MSRATRDRRRVRVDDVVTWGRGVAAYRVESIDANRAVLDVSIEAGSRWFRDVTVEPDGRRLLRVQLCRLRVVWRPGAPGRVNRRRR